MEELWERHHGFTKLAVKSGGLDRLREMIANQAIADSSGVRSTRSNRVRRGADPEIDAAWAEEVRSAAEAEYSGVSRPVRMTANRLCQRANGPRKAAPDEFAYPLTTKALRENSESRWHYLARKLVWSQLTFPAGTSAWVVHEAASIHAEFANALRGYFGDRVPSGVEPTPGAIMLLLKRMQIGKQWEGLQPDWQFVVPGGRAYKRRPRKRHSPPEAV
jgi:hypothetical protein